MAERTMTQIAHRITGAVLFEDESPTIRETLQNAVQQGASLMGANLWSADLGGADLEGAYLGGADLWSAFLMNANLGGPHPLGADLRGAYLWGAYLGGAYLTGMKWDEKTDFTSIQMNKGTKMERGLALHLHGYTQDAKDLEETEKLLQELKHYLEEGRWDQARRVFRQIPGMYPKVEKPED